MSSQSLPQFFDAPALLVEARFRERPIFTRLVSVSAARGVTVGAGRGADAPIDPTFLPAFLPAFLSASAGELAANDNHVLVEPTGAGFLINLSPAMRAGLEETPTRLRIPCGEVIFDLTAAGPAPAVARPWLARSWRADAPYAAGVAAALLLLLALVRAVPSDPHALSLDDIGRTVRLDPYLIVPPAPVAPPPVPGSRKAGGSAPAAVASGPSGAAGDRKARPADTRRATKGPAANQDARAVERYVRDNTMLAVLDGPRAGAFAEVLAPAPALGSGVDDVLAHLEGRNIADAYGHSGFGPRGTGASGADTGRPLLGGTPGLRTLGRGGGQRGGDLGYGHDVGGLRPPKPHEVAIAIRDPKVRGSLDKEIVRRIVRQHLNEVRFCYEEALARRPSLAGRVVVQFTIAPTGRVLVSALQSSSVGEVRVDACIVEATRRWEYPRPDGGGLVVVSYPFQLTPAGG